jgi:hypothetical protein
MNFMLAWGTFFICYFNTVPNLLVNIEEYKLDNNVFNTNTNDYTLFIQWENRIYLKINNILSGICFQWLFYFNSIYRILKRLCKYVPFEYFLCSSCTYDWFQVIF